MPKNKIHLIYFLFFSFFTLFGEKINAQCTAAITSSINPPKGCSPFTIQLTDASTGITSTRTWNFGDGSAPSSVQNPIHTFNKNTGNDTTYVVTLKSYCLNGDSSVATMTITVYSPPKVNFTAPNLSICALSDTVCFNNTSETGTGYTYNWTFGDNTSSSLYSPCKIYSNDGVYNVNLTVTDSNGCQVSLPRNNYITVKKAPNPDFTVSPQIGCGPLSVLFTNTTNTTVDTISSWVWTFGDATGSSSQSPGVHTYTLAPDTPIVRLLATNNLGCTNYTTKVIVVKPTPVATFTLDAQICPGETATATFTGTAGASSSYIWNFNGATINSGTGQGPYNLTWATSGIKNVSLIVNDNGCSDTASQSILVNPLPIVTLSSNAVNDTICDGSPVVFTASPGNYLNYIFYLNSTAVQNSASNIYNNSTLNNHDTIRVSATDINGCQSPLSTTIIIKVKPIPTVTLSLTSNDSICEGDSSHFLVLPAGLNGGYTFYDAFSPVQIGSSNVLNYLRNQNHTITVIGSKDGCASLASNAVLVHVIKKILPTTVNCGTSTSATINFTWDPVPTATGFEVSINGGPFTTPSTGSLGLSHLLTGLSLNDSATIIVRTIGPAPCIDTVYSSLVKCYARNCTGITFSLVGPTSACVGDSITASAISINPGTYNIKWNGGAPTVINFFTVHNVTTDTSISAVISNTAQPTCPAVSRTLTVDVNPLPVVSLSSSEPNDSICTGQVITFTATPTSYSNYAYYNGPGIIQNSANPYYTSGSLTSGSIIKVVATEQGCSSVSSNTINYTVIPPLNLPQVNCGTTTDSTISFLWNSVTGALGYQVSINGGAYGTPSSGSLGLLHLLTGQTIGSSATIEIKALGPPPCGNSVISFAKTCYAKPCDSIVFNAPTSLDVCAGSTADLLISGINVPSYNVYWNGGSATTDTTYSYIPGVSGIIPVSVQNVSQPGCPNATHYTSINVIPLPVVTVSSDAVNDSSCFGSPITFSANPQIYSNYSFFDNFALVQNGVNPTYTTSNFQNGHVIKIIVTNQGCSDTSTNTVSPVITAPLLTPQVNCGTTTNNTISFTWDTIPGALGYEVSIGGGQFITPSSGITGTLHTINGFSAGDSISIRVRAIGSTPCGSSAVSPPVTCYAMPCTGITFQLPATDTICQGMSIALTASNIVPPTFSIRWNGGAPTTATTFSLTPPSTTTVTAVITNTAQPLCPTAKKYTKVYVTPTPASSLSFSSLNYSICTGDLISVIATPATYDMYTFFNGTTQVQIGGNPALTTNTLTGVNTFSVITNYQGCLDTSATVTLTVIPPLILNYSSNAVNDSLCQGVTLNLTANPSTLTRYVFRVNGVQRQDSPSNLFSYSALPPGNNIITITGYNYLGCTNSPNDTVYITTLPYDPVTLIADAFDSICNHQVVTFTATPSGLPSYSFYRNGTLVQTGSSDRYNTGTLTQTDTITVKGTNVIGCLSAASSGISFTIRPTADPTITGGDTLQYCLTFGSPLTLIASVGGTFTPVTYTWSNGSGGTSISVSPTTNTYYNVYTLYKGCLSARDTALIMVDDQPLPTAAATPLDGKICIGDSIQLQGSGSGLSLMWRTTTGTTIATQPNVFVKPIVDSTFVFRSMNAACYRDVNVRVVVDKCLIDLSGPIPQIITPNGDGANDTWIIPDIDYFTKNKVSIYNRWGQLVYDKSPYDNSWRGEEMKSGKDLPDGSYYYVVLLGDEFDSKKYVGFVIIHR